MKLAELLKMFNTDFGTLSFIAFILFTIVEVAPIKLNPWSKLIKWFSTIANENLMNKMDSLEEKMNEMDHRFSGEITKINNKMEIQDIMNVRIRILRFGNEVKNKVKHTEEHFYEILQDIDTYELYCDSHKNFKNNRCDATIKIIKETYDDRIKNNDFL